MLEVIAERLACLGDV